MTTGRSFVLVTGFGCASLSRRVIQRRHRAVRGDKQRPLAVSGLTIVGASRGFLRCTKENAGWKFFHPARMSGSSLLDIGEPLTWADLDQGVEVGGCTRMDWAST
jgi:hypothetical protein